MEKWRFTLGQIIQLKLNTTDLLTPLVTSGKSKIITIILSLMKMIMILK